MHKSSFFDDDDDDFFKELEEQTKTIHAVNRGLTGMGIMTVVAGVTVAVVLIALLCHCCRKRSRERGRVLSPPPDVSAAPAVYPRQPAPAAYAGPAPYPSYPAPYPAANTTQYPVASPAPYPVTSPAPYPVTSPAPYPVASPAPYPVTSPAPYPVTSPASYPVTSPAPTAPDLHAMPPSYEQATGGVAKQHPYNPAHPH